MLTTLRRHSPSTVRLIECLPLAVAALVGQLVAGLSWQVVVLGVWVGCASSFLTLTWRDVFGLTAAQTAVRAMREDDSRAEASLIVTLASVASLGGVGFGLVHAGRLNGGAELVVTVLCVASVGLSWMVVHTVFTLRYAHEYFTSDGGIQFGDELPTYVDFAYVAFTVGMTFQVSDTDITSRAIRATVLRHALLSYLFGTFIVAVMINVVAGLLR